MECQEDCQYYEKCEAFIYYNDYRCFLFYLNTDTSAFNEQIVSDSNRNYTYGFKSTIMMKKLDSVSLGENYAYRKDNFSESECIQWCLSIESCIGSTFTEHSCLLYKILHAQYMLETPHADSHILPDIYQAPLQLTDGSDEMQIGTEEMKLDGYELNEAYTGSYALNARQCWLNCRKSEHCRASSFYKEFHKPNQALTKNFNCYFYDKNFRMIENPEWSSFVNIDGNLFLTNIFSK